MTLCYTAGRFHQKWVQRHRVQFPKRSQSNQCPRCLMGRGQACPWGQSMTSMQQASLELKAGVPRSKSWPQYFLVLWRWEMHLRNLCGEEQDGGGVDGHGLISLYGYIRNTPSDTEVLAEHQLRAGRSAWPPEKNIQTHAKLGMMKELEGQTWVLVWPVFKAEVWSPQ